LQIGSIYDTYRIEMRSGYASDALLAVLRKRLRACGWTAPRIAAELGVGEATVKRWKAGRGLTLPRLEVLLGLCGLTFAELAREAEQGQSELARELTLAQERELASDVLLAFFFSAILADIPPQEIAEDFDIDAGLVEAKLVRLERLALIDRRPGLRVRSRVDPAASFMKTPLRGMFETYMKPQFMELDFADPDTSFSAELVKLSRAGAARLAEMIERHRHEVLALAKEDREQALLGQRWFTALSVMRPLNTARLRDLSRAAGVKARSS